MADYKLTVALNAADLPPISRLKQRSVLIAGLDGKLRDPSSSNVQNLDNNPSNIPQVLYAENIIPTDGGIKSVGYNQVHAGAAPGNTNFDEIYILRDVNETTWFFSPARGYNFVAQTLADPWVSTSPVAGAPLANKQFSLAYVNGVTYICYERTYLGEWNGATFIDRSAALLGVAIANVIAICGAGNYLVVITTDSSTKWSSLTNPLDFVPSVLTGAGAQTPSDIRGPIHYATPTSGGFLLHCYSNTVAALYTQNSAAPWIFREVRNSGGTNGDSNRITKDGTGGQVFTWSTAGLQSLTLRDAETIHPQVSDFLGGRVIEQYNTATGQFALTKAGDIAVKVNFLNNRFFCISYGTAALTYLYVLIYDVALKRWGKLAISHVDMFSGYGDYKESIYALQLDGTVKQVIMDDRTFADTGVVILGRYQLNRTNRICSQECELELLDATEACTVEVLSYDNGTVPSAPLAMVLAETGDNYRDYQYQIEGESLAFVIRGTFTLATALLTFTKGAGSNT